jgi:hypothetical protein
MNRVAESTIIIEQGEDRMRTNLRSGQLRTTPTSTIALYLGDGLRATGAEASFRAERLLAEAARDQAADRRPGLRRHLGHAIMAVGRAVIAIGHAIYGHEVEAPARPALDTH